MLVIALLVGGTGAATQHPIGSSLVVAAYAGKAARGPLGTYNFAGDVGKMALPAATAWLLGVMPWRSALGWIGTLGLATAVLILVLLPPNATLAKAAQDDDAQPLAAATQPRQRHGFPILFLIGVLDSGTRMGFLAFLPFVLKAKGADTAMIGVALTLIFAGGAAGKLACGWLGARVGVLRTVFLTELGTAVGIAVLSASTLSTGLICPPPSKRGSSPPLTSAGIRHILHRNDRWRRDRTVALRLCRRCFGPARAVFVVATVCLLTLPLAWGLRPSFARR